MIKRLPKSEEQTTFLDDEAQEREECPRCHLSTKHLWSKGLGYVCGRCYIELTNEEERKKGE